MRVKQILVAAALIWVIAPATARADGFLSPFIGANFGGDASEVYDLGGSSSSRLDYGVSLGWMGGGATGFELDLAHSPKFFETSDTDGNVTTLMANIIVGAPIGGMNRGVRPYVLGGVGLIRKRVQDVNDFFNISRNDFGVDLGGGVMGFFSDNVGIRGDIRYFRSLQNEDTDELIDISFGNFDFWRGTIGLAFRF